MNFAYLSPSEVRYLPKILPRLVYGNSQVTLYAVERFFLFFCYRVSPPSVASTRTGGKTARHTSFKFFRHHLGIHQHRCIEARCTQNMNAEPTHGRKVSILILLSSLPVCIMFLYVDAGVVDESQNKMKEKKTTPSKIL